MGSGRGKVQTGPGRRPVQHPEGGVEVRPHSRGLPHGSVHAVEGQAGVRVTRWHLHPEQPVELPAGLLDQGRLETGGRRMPADQLNRGEQLPDRQRTGGDVLAVVPGVVPAARDVEQSVLGPARVERPGVGSLPRGHGRVPGVRGDAGMAGRSAVARGPDLLDGATRPLQIEEPQRVPSQPHVQPTVDHEPVTGRLTGPDHGKTQRW